MIIMIHLPSCSIAFLTCSLHTALQPSHAASILAYCSTWAGGNHLTGWQENAPEYLHLCVIGWSCLRPAPAAPHHLMIGVSSEQPGAVLCVDTALYQHQTRRAAVSTFSRGSLAPNTGEHCTLQHRATVPGSPHAAADRDPMVSCRCAARCQEEVGTSTWHQPGHTTLPPAAGYRQHQHFYILSST